jgi:hypothetical protein
VETISATYALGIDPLSWGKPIIENMRWCQLVVQAHIKHGMGYNGIGENCFQVLRAVPLLLAAGGLLRWRLITDQTGCHPSTDSRQQTSAVAKPALVCSAPMA